MRIHPFISIWMAAGWLCATASAQDTSIPLRLPLSEAVRIAGEQNPALVTARRQSVVADTARLAAARRPNPVIGLSSEGFAPGRSPATGFLNGQEFVLQVDQEIETAGRRSLRARSATAGAATARSALADVERQVRLDVRRTYFELVLAGAEASAAAEALAEIDRVIAVNRAKYAQGEISGGELRRLEVERLRFTDDALAAELMIRDGRSRLLALLGSARLDLPIEPTDPLRSPLAGAPAGDAAAMVAAAQAARPDLQAARHEQARAKAEGQLQRAERVPNVSVGAGYRRDFGENGVVFALSVPLPVLDRNQSGLARADAESRVADARLREIEVAVSLEVQQALDALAISRRRVEMLEREYLAKAREARDAVLAAYKAGANELTDFLDAQRSYRDVQRAHVRALLELRLSESRLDAAVGSPSRGPLS